MLNVLQTLKTNRAANRTLKVGLITSLINNKYGELSIISLRVKSSFGTSTARTSRERMDGWRHCYTQRVHHNSSFPPSQREPMGIPKCESLFLDFKKELTESNPAGGAVSDV